MARTSRDIFIKGVTIDQAKAAVVEWFAKNNVKVLIDNADYVYGRLGRGILTAPKFFEVTLMPVEGGIKAKTEGWIANVPPSFLPDARAYLPKTEFSESARVLGGIPHKAGMKAIKRLWGTLETL